MEKIDVKAAWTRFVDATFELAEKLRHLPLAQAGVCQNYYQDICMITIPISGDFIREAETGDESLQRFAALVKSLPVCEHTVVFSIDELNRCAVALRPYVHEVGLEGATLSAVIESLVERVRRLNREKEALLTKSAERPDD